MRTVLIVLMLLMAAPVMAQTNPCTTPATTVSVNPSSIYIEHASFSQEFPDGSPVIREVTLGVFLQGVDPATGAPVTSVTLPRSAFAPVGSSAPNCYVTKLAQPLAVPIAVEHMGAARAVNQYGSSPWVTSNPFFAAGAPSGFSSARLR